MVSREFLECNEKTPLINFGKELQGFEVVGVLVLPLNVPDLPCNLYFEDRVPYRVIYNQKGNSKWVWSSWSYVYPTRPFSAARGGQTSGRLECRTEDTESWTIETFFSLRARGGRGLTT